MPKAEHKVRRDGSTRRAIKRTILLVTNGAVTERSYLGELKRRAHAVSRDLRIEVKCIEGEPSTMLRKLASPQGDPSGYDEVWIVIDEDGNDREPVLAECRRRTVKKQKWHCVVSRPCFEVWLTAHYEQVRNYRDQREAQEHWARVSGVADGRKRLPSGFPFCSRRPGSGQDLDGWCCRPAEEV